MQLYDLAIITELYIFSFFMVTHTKVQFWHLWLSGKPTCLLRLAHTVLRNTVIYKDTQWTYKIPSTILQHNIWCFHNTLCGPGSIVSIATVYALDSPGIESQCGKIFCTSPDRPWGPPSLLYNGYWVFPGGKVLPGRDADPSLPSSAEV